MAMLHDWSSLPGWEGVHQLWMVELLHAIKPQLPSAYRVYIGATPAFAIGSPEAGRPDVGVRDWPADVPAVSAPGPDWEPDDEFPVATLASDVTLQVERGGRLVAAIELVSPRNKDRASAQLTYTSAYAGYLLRGAHLLLIDVHRRPAAFSFADQIAGTLGVPQPSLPPPFAIGYRVGEPAPNRGRFLALWRRPLAVGEALPTLRLSLSLAESVEVNLDATYQRAAEAAYLA